MMLLAIDVGNATVNVGIFKGRRIVYTKKIATKKPASTKYYLKKFKQLLFLRKQESKSKRMDSRFPRFRGGGNDKCTNVIISSVVPGTTRALKVVFKNNFHIRPVVLGEDLIVPIKNLYKDPKQVGQDRLVNAYAGYRKFGGGLIIVDFGTAVTFDVVSKKGEYIGGIIVPGIETALGALTEKAALLGAVGESALQKIPSPLWGEGKGEGGSKRVGLIGMDTLGSILSGVMHGYGVLCDGLVAKIKREVSADFKVILTGGHAKLISKYCHFDTLQPNLTLDGLRDVFKTKLRPVPKIEFGTGPN